MYYAMIVNFFKFQSFSITNGKNAMREEFSISGKGRKGNVLLFSLFAVMFLIIYFTICRSIRIRIYTVIVFFVTLLILFIRHKLLFRKLEKKIKNYNLYQREKPSNLRPAHVRMLLKDGLIDELSIVATIADLIDRGYLKISGEFAQFFKKDSVLSIEKTDKLQDDLLLYEKYLIEWFIDICGNGKSVTNTDLKNILRERVTISSNDRFNDFKGLVITSFPINAFYIKRNNTRELIIYLIMLLVGFFACLISGVLVFLPVFGLGSILFNCPPYILNDNGKVEINNWKSLKKFLVDFSNIKEKNAQMIELWNFYLTYSIILGVNRDAKEEIFTFFGNSIDTGSGDEMKGYSNDSKLNYNTSDRNVAKYDASPLMLGLYKRDIADIVNEEAIKYQFKQNM